MRIEQQPVLGAINLGLVLLPGNRTAGIGYQQRPLPRIAGPVDQTGIIVDGLSQLVGRHLGFGGNESQIRAVIAHHDRRDLDVPQFGIGCSEPPTPARMLVRRTKPGLQVLVEIGRIQSIQTQQCVANGGVEGGRQRWGGWRSGNRHSVQYQQQQNPATDTTGQASDSGA